MSISTSVCRTVVAAPSLAPPPATSKSEKSAA